MTVDTKILVERSFNFFGDGYMVWIYQKGPSGVLSVADTLTMTNTQECAVRPNPLMTLSKEAATELMNHLWQAGVRPNANITPDADLRAAYGVTLKAKDDHIKDLRTILFNRMTIEEAQ